jgi:glycosyltransferase involved in cell wall biosynthesis
MQTLKRILIVTETGDAWPSGYIRALIYKDLFRSDGIECDYMSRCRPSINRLTTRPGRLSRILYYSGLGDILIHRLNQRIGRYREGSIIHRSQNGYDAIYLQKVSSPNLISALRRVSKARLVYDLNDAVWLPANHNFAGGQVSHILKVVDAVTCDNPYGLAYARAFNNSLFLVPDPPQVEVFDVNRSSVAKSGSQIILGWIGSPTSLYNLFAIWEPLEALFARFKGITLRLLGTGYSKPLQPRFEKVSYSALPYYTNKQMIQEVLRMDIGLFPLFDIDESRARGILKATIYMSGEASVVAAPVGQNCELIRDGTNGMLARNAQEWLDKLSGLIENSVLRQRIARFGLETVREKYTVQRCYEKLKEALVGRHAN